MTESQDPNSAKRTRGALSRVVAVLISLGLAAVVLVGVCSFMGRPHVLELLSHFRMQAFFLAIVLSAAAVLLRRRILFAASIACIVFAGWPLAPLWFGGGAAAAPGRETLRILHSNVLTQNRDRQAVMEEVLRHDPDIVILQEVNRRWLRDLEPLLERYPIVERDERENNFGIAILSRIPLYDVIIEGLGSDETPAIRASVELEGRRLRIVAVHPVPPLSAAGFEQRNAQIDELNDRLADEPRPLVVIGDLNTTMWSPYYADLVEPHDLRNAREGFGVLPTWPVQYPAFMRIPIDHCLVSPEVDVLDCRVGEPVGSDHLPLVVDIALRAALPEAR